MRARAAILVNTGTLIAFCLGYEDATLIAPDFDKIRGAFN